MVNELLSILFSDVVVAAAFVVHLSIRFETVRLGYEVSEERGRQRELLQDRRLLSIEGATLRHDDFFSEPCGAPFATPPLRAARVPPAVAYAAKYRRPAAAEHRRPDATARRGGGLGGSDADDASNDEGEEDAAAPRASGPARFETGDGVDTSSDTTSSESDESVDQVLTACRFFKTRAWPIAGRRVCCQQPV